MSMAVETQLIRIGWAYREPAWSDDHEWHLCRGKPAERQGRDIRPVYLGPENGPYLWPSLSGRNPEPPRIPGWFCGNVGCEVVGDHTHGGGVEPTATHGRSVPPPESPSPPSPGVTA